MIITKNCKECGKPFYITKPALNSKKYCSIECKKQHYKKRTRISIRKCAWCNKEYIAVHDKHVSKFCCSKHAYYSKLQSNLKSVRKYQKLYTHPTNQAWLGNSNLKSHLSSDNWDDELLKIQNEFKRLRIKKLLK